MNTIITDCVEKFNTEIQEFLKDSENLSLEKAESGLFERAYAFVTIMLGYIYECKDREIEEDTEYRKENGLVIERKHDKREIVTRLGMLKYNRTYYKKKVGGYVYPIDELIGIDAYMRVSGGTSLALVQSAIHQSYEKASIEVTNGIVSKQTVMNCIRKANVPTPKESKELKKVPYLHIDADEDHVKLAKGKGKGVIVPLVTVYEGIEKQGKRGICKNRFSVSDYGKSAQDIWEKVCTEVSCQYDITDTKIYVHGDGGAWIKSAKEWFPNAQFVLDQYHKNKYIKSSTAGFTGNECTKYQDRIRKIIESGEKEELLVVQAEMCETHPERMGNIKKSTGYLYSNFEAIDIRRTDSEACNGGCTEPHVSHILSSRLSSRPMAWSEDTLKHIAPILAAQKYTFDEPEKAEKIVYHHWARTDTKKVKPVENSCGLPDPDLSANIAGSFNGRIKGAFGIIKPMLGF